MHRGASLHEEIPRHLEIESVHAIGGQDRDAVAAETIRVVYRL